MSDDLCRELDRYVDPAPRQNRRDFTELTPRQQLLDQISEQFCYAIQADLENGVASLNVSAAEEFKRKYPALNAAISWLNDLHADEMPSDY